jgi:predicted nucleotidyltransferase
LERALAAVDGVERAFIYGSWAARYLGEPGDAPNDLDVLVVGKPDADELFAIADEARASLRREVNIRSIRPAVWNNPASKDAFLATVRSRPLIELTIKGAHP